jgi:hypothetical protein
MKDRGGSIAVNSPLSPLSTGSDDVTYFGLGFLFYHWTLYPVSLSLSFVSDSRAEREKRDPHLPAYFLSVA